MMIQPPPGRPTAAGSQSSQARRFTSFHSKAPRTTASSAAAGTADWTGPRNACRLLLRELVHLAANLVRDWDADAHGVERRPYVGDGGRAGGRVDPVVMRHQGREVRVVGRNQLNRG